MSPLKVTIFLAVGLCLFANYINAEEAKNNDDDENVIKIFKRLIPADVLRDFPGMCFASTRCATVEPGKSWDLSPFCGKSTCVVSNDNSGRLQELVEDCGPLPLENNRCKLDTDKTNKSAPFPYCCPKFTCEPGVKLEYPEIKTESPNEKQ